MAFVSSPFLSPLRQTSFINNSQCPIAIPRYHTCPPSTTTTNSIITAILHTFQPSDFEIRRIVGQQSFATITDWEYYTPAPLAPTRTTEPSVSAIRLYDARIIAPSLEYYNVRVLLKEFLPPAVEIGVTEAEAYNLLYDPRSTSNRDAVPIATLLGSFVTDASFGDDSFAITWRARFPKSPKPPAPGAPFLVFRWEGLQTAMTLASTPPTLTPPEQLFDRWFPRNLAQRKAVYLRAFIARTLDALLYLHTRAGLVHRSIGLASLMVNTSEWRYASNLLVKLRDLGFAKPVSSLAQGDDLDRARRSNAITPADITAFYFADDIYAAGYALLELIFSVFSGNPVTQDRFKNLFEDTFEFSADQIRDYCAQDPAWVDAVTFLDEYDAAGWSLLLSMLQAKKDFKTVSIQELREYPFLEEAT